MVRGRSMQKSEDVLEINLVGDYFGLRPLPGDGADLYSMSRFTLPIVWILRVHFMHVYNVSPEAAASTHTLGQLLLRSF
jgi:hypothetical protein